MFAGAEASVGTRRSRRITFSSSGMAGILGHSSLNSHDRVTLFLRYTTAVMPGMSGVHSDEKTGENVWVARYLRVVGLHLGRMR